MKTIAMTITYLSKTVEPNKTDNFSSFLKLTEFYSKFTRKL